MRLGRRVHPREACRTSEGKRTEIDAAALQIRSGDF